MECRSYDDGEMAQALIDAGRPIVTKRPDGSVERLWPVRVRVVEEPDGFVRVWINETPYQIPD